MIILRIFALVLVSLSMSDTFAAVVSKEATYYADSFEWARTANGDVFSHSGFTAAACGIPLGKNVYVSSNDVGALIRINDRPNCSRFPNVIDLSKSSFSLFAPLSAGRIQSVDVDTLDTLDVSLFRSLWVELSPGTPSVYFAGDGTIFRGRVTDNKNWVILIIENSVGSWRQDYFFSLDKNKWFVAPIQLPKIPGEYNIIFVSERSGEFSFGKRTTIRIISQENFTSHVSEILTKTVIPSIQEKNDSNFIDFGDSFWGSLNLTQDTKTFETHGTRMFFDSLPRYHLGNADARITAYQIDSGGSLDRISWLSTFFSGSVILDRTHQFIGQKFARIRNYKNHTTVKFQVPKSPRISADYFLTLPNGNVLKFQFPKWVIWSDNSFLIPGKDITFSIPTSDTWTYLIETVQETGVAYFNLPITRGIVWSIIKPYEKESMKNIRKDRDIVAKYALWRINTIRSWIGRSLLSLDDLLSRIAQAKVDDMIARKYLGHIDPDGNRIWEFAKLKWFEYVWTIGENLAYGNASDIVLQDGLEESWGHRFNMIEPIFKKFGFWYGIDNGNLYIVQVFWE